LHSKCLLLQIAIELLNMHPLWFADSVTACEARNICLNWYLHVVQAGEIDHEHTVGSDEVRFHLTRPEFACLYLWGMLKEKV
jgi:hypothetical protein